MEDDPTSNSLDLTTLIDSSVIPSEFLPSSKRLRMFKQSSHCNFFLFFNFLITEEKSSQDFLKDNIFPADFLEKYEIFELLGKVFFNFFSKLELLVYRVNKLKFIKSKADQQMNILQQSFTSQQTKKLKNVIF